MDMPHVKKGRKPANEIDILVGKRIRTLCATRGMTMMQLADQIGTTYQQVFKYMEGINRVSAGRLHDISIALGTPISSFFDEDAPNVEKGNGVTDDLAELVNGYAALQPNARKTIREMVSLMAEKSS